MLPLSPGLIKSYSIGCYLALKLNHKELDILHLIYGIYKSSSFVKKLFEKSFYTEYWVQYFIAHLIPAGNEPLENNYEIGKYRSSDLVKCLEKSNYISSQVKETMISYNLFLLVALNQPGIHLTLLGKILPVETLQSMIYCETNSCHYAYHLNKPRNKVTILS